MDAIIMKEPENIVETMLIEQKRSKVASIIQTARVQKGWTQEDLAERLGIRRQTIIKIEGCKYSPNADMLYLILECLDLTLKIGDEEV